jgi:hypothetical protein
MMEIIWSLEKNADASAILLVHAALCGGHEGFPCEKSVPTGTEAFGQSEP